MNTLAEAFDAAAKRLDLDDGQRKQVSERSQRLISILQGIWHPSKIVPIGSWARGTAVPPIHDVDYMVVVGDGVPNRTPDDMLEAVKRTLQPKYPEVGTRTQKRSVGLLFRDFGVDLVPAFSGPAVAYQIPDLQTGTWIQTNPVLHTDFAAGINGGTGGMAGRIVKLLKIWNVNKQVGLKSFHLEVMALRAIEKNKPTMGYAHGLRDTLTAIASAVEAECSDPGSPNRDLGDYLGRHSPRRANVAQTCRKAAAEVDQAIREEAQRQPGVAINRVRTLVGSPF